MYLLLTLNIFHTFSSVSIVDFEQVSVCQVANTSLNLKLAGSISTKESTKNMKNDFYFTEKAPFILEIF